MPFHFLFLLVTLLGCTVLTTPTYAVPLSTTPKPTTALATFAGGCFWCMQPPFDTAKGVLKTVAGYTGGAEKNPRYDDVGAGKTGHCEAVQITYDPSLITYEALVDIFFRSMDPTDAGGQFADRGKQYRPAIFFHSPEQQKTAEQAKDKLAKSGRFKKSLIVPVEAALIFWPAEDYHQHYYKKNPAHYYSYRKASGREGFLKTTWGDDPWAKH